MKFFFIVISFVILVSNKLNAQVVINNKDSTLANYLTKSIKYLNISDTCFVGIYNISFRLNSEKKLVDFDCSKSLPNNLAGKIKTLMIALDNSWDSSFVKQAINYKIVQPLFLVIQNNCILSKPKNHLQLKNPNNTDLDLVNKIDQTNLMIDLANLLVSSQYTFKESNVFLKEGEKSYESCILLKPALIVNENIKTKAFGK